MQPIFDTPVSPGQFQQLIGIGLFGGQAGHTVYDFTSLFVGDQGGDIALNAENLPDIWEEQVSVEFGAGPDVADFEAAVGFIDGSRFRGEKRSD